MKYSGLTKKNNLIKRVSVVMFLVSGVAFNSVSQTAEPVGMLLTWQQDPSTTMTIDWQAESHHEAKTIFHYKPVGSDRWHEVQGSKRDFPDSDRVIIRVELTGLEQGSYYRFRVGEFEREFKFRTMPGDLMEESVVFATGGDTRHSQRRLERTNHVALQYDPDFIAWGGDLAYCDGVPERVDRWYQWFESNMKSLITEEGRVIPIIAGIGNHEMRGGYLHNHDDYEETVEWRNEYAPYYYDLFAFPGQPGYNVLDFGSYLSLIVLDTDHTNPVTGNQTEWLEQVLNARTEIPHVFPLYHVPAYPSHRSPEGRTNTRVRENWVPLFEEYGVRVAFENHDHAYKRTHPIRDGRIDPAGITYIGDGAWGVSPRDGNYRDEWYIKQFAGVNHAIIVTLQGTDRHFLMVSGDGEIIDEYSQTNSKESSGRY